MADDQGVPGTRAKAAAGALFFDDQDPVMLVRPNYKDYHDIPGGYIEPGETSYEACVREVKEELGIEPPIGRLLVADWAPHPTEGDKILFIFDGGHLSPADLDQVRLDPTELSNLRLPRSGRTAATADSSAATAHRIGDQGPEDWGGYLP